MSLQNVGHTFNFSAISQITCPRPALPLDKGGDLSDFFDNSVKYHRRTSLVSIGGDLYKFHDDSIRPRRFLSADNEDGTNGHSLHKIIDGDDPLCPIIDFDLSQVTLNTIEPKLTRNDVAKILVQAFCGVCKEVFPEWNENTLTLATSDNTKKISFYVSTTANKRSFFLQILE
ncbi:hypothetical protein RclHR1_04820017 [Rhizophagus clarus]|uniref:Uncharacterized protein n=1 Tax=Rhizophagus clarus TaxID=94130 RepID=A0A2Z6SDA4_9GLOM|nr:hypothetical protein RclHR1_04820017 [Rhizophagus clarus]GES81918.1 hypothetical protein GLOIN_2v1770262 [Rhizophagus clarus]